MGGWVAAAYVCVFGRRNVALWCRLRRVVGANHRICERESSGVCMISYVQQRRLDFYIVMLRATLHTRCHRRVPLAHISLILSAVLSLTHTCTSGTTTRDESHMPESWTLMRCVFILFCAMGKNSAGRGCVSFEGRRGGGKMKSASGTLPVAK